MYLCRELTDASLSDIGKLLGKKDHTTIMNGINKITDRIKNEEELSTRVKSIKSKIIEK